MLIDWNTIRGEGGAGVSGNRVEIDAGTMGDGHRNPIQGGEGGERKGGLTLQLEQSGDAQRN